MRRRLEQAWRERSAGERRTLGAGAALLAVALGYAYVWLPVSSERDRLVSEVPRLRSELLQLRSDASEIERLRASARGAPPDLRILLEALPGPKASELAAEAGGRTRAVFAKVRVDDWLAWIAALQVEHGIRIENVRVQALEEPNMIKATATLSGGS